MTIQRRLAKTILESMYVELETNAQHSTNVRLAQRAGNATIVLGFDELTEQFASLLERYRFSGAGQASNFNPLSFYYELDSLIENVKQHPVFPEDYAIQLFTKFRRSMLPYVNSGLAELLKGARTESDVEDIAVSQAILGRYDEAMATCQSMRDPYRQDHVRYIICIEHYRRDHIEKAQAVHSTLTARTFSTSTGVQFALGICNRVPWGVYPYSDC